MSISEPEFSGREGFEHHRIVPTGLTTLEGRLEELFTNEPSEWSDLDKAEWEQVVTEVRRQFEGSRVFSIGDEAVLVGYTITKTNGAVGFMDEYNENEYDVIITGYNRDTDKWEVMVPEEELREILGDETVDDERWREFYITERPANGGVTGYVMTAWHREAPSGSYRKKGVYEINDTPNITPAIAE